MEGKHAVLQCTGTGYTKFSSISCLFEDRGLQSGTDTQISWNTKQARLTIHQVRLMNILCALPHQLHHSLSLVPNLMIMANNPSEAMPLKLLNLTEEVEVVALKRNHLMSKILTYPPTLPAISTSASKLIDL